MLRKILRCSFSEYLNKKYILSQFPYPSGDLHLGHARVYYIGDSISTYYRLNNYKVIYPIGWDSFGLPAQNAAIVHGKNPKEWTESNIQKMKQQLMHLDINFNWEMEISTSQPQYYMWTQQIFLKMFKKGLAYKKMAEVNWDPVDKTVLANQQVDHNGYSWRSGAKVQKKQLSQWFLKITDYAQLLQDGLNKLEWVEKVKNMQRGWIGFRKGYEIAFQIKNKNDKPKQSDSILVFVEEIESLRSATFVIKKLLNQYGAQIETKRQNDVVHGTAINPYNMQQLLIIHSEEEQSQTYIVISQKDMKKNERYRNLFNKFGKKVKQKQKGKQKYNLKVQPILEIKKEDLLSSAKAIQQIKLKDWLISRQRFWGCPIPVVYCKSCGTVPVPQSQLPVILPQWNNNGNPLLQEQFKKCNCPQCGLEDAERQTDTMDTFVDSSWYYLRFMDNSNQKEIFSKSNIQQMLPVDIYIGGIQHAIMHLLYARFVMRFIRQEYKLSEKCTEPFKELVVQGLVKGRTLVLKENGKYISQREIDEGKYKIEDVKISFQKMSKSKFNGLNPNILVEKYGSDALRTAIFFANPPDRDIDFSQEMVVSSQKFLNRIQSLWKQLLLLNQTNITSQINQSQQLLPKEQLLKLKNIFQKMQISIQKRLMHTYVANVMQMFNLIKEFVQIKSIKIHHFNKVRLFAIFVQVLKVIAPRLANILQQAMLRNFPLILNQKDFEMWPSDQLFGQKIQLLIMKGKKMVTKDTVEIKVTDEEIIKKLKLQGKIQQIKRQKKKFVVILKD